jgi:hypothetical protein
MPTNYIKDLEDRVEELQQKLAKTESSLLSYQNGLTPYFTPERAVMKEHTGPQVICSFRTDLYAIANILYDTWNNEYYWQFIDSRATGNDSESSTNIEVIKNDILVTYSNYLEYHKTNTQMGFDIYGRLH